MRKTILVVAALALVGGVLSAVAAAENGGDTYAACLSPGGALSKVAVGEEPAEPCSGAQAQIGWSEGMSQADLEDLLARIDNLESNLSPLDVTVDCAAGQSLQGAIWSWGAGGPHPGPLNIGISGLCEENIVIDRDDVSLYGMTPGDGISGPDGDQATVSVWNAHRVEFSNMTISGAGEGIEVETSTVWLREVTLADNGSNGLQVREGGFVDVVDSEIIDNGDFGIYAGGVGSSEIVMRGTTIARNDRLGIVAERSTLRIDDSVIEDNGGQGILADASDVVLSGTRIAGSEYAGIVARMSSVFSVGNGTVIENNGGDGIVAEDLSIIRVNPIDIVGNGGWGIVCKGPAGILDAQAHLDPAIVFSGNGSGDTNCPI